MAQAPNCFVVADIHKFRECGCCPLYTCTYCGLQFRAITTAAPLAGKVQYCPRCGERNEPQTLR